MEKTYKVKGMSCQHCVKAVEMELKELDLRFSSVAIGHIEVKFDENKVTEDQISEAIQEAGFEMDK